MRLISWIVKNNSVPIPERAFEINSNAFIRCAERWFVFFDVQ
jgi:hypothetical protein